MTALFVSALVNAAILSLGTTGFLWLLLRVVPRTAINAATRYGLWWVALMLTVALPFVFVQTPRPATLGSLPVQALAMKLELTSQQVSEPAVLVQPSLNSPVVSPKSADETVPLQGASRWSRLLSQLNMFPLRVRAGLWLNLALAAWLLATLTLLGRLIASFMILRHRSSRSRDVPEHFYGKATQWPSLREIGSRTFRVAISNDVDTPLALGFRKPSILIPASYLDEFEEADIERMCVHEAAHLNRRDDLTLLVQRFVEAVLPWHPAVYWISRQLDFEREAACDDWTVQATGQYKDYALCLTRVAERGGSRAALLTTPTVIGRRSELSRRVDSLLAQKDRSRPRIFKLRFVALALLFTGVVFAGGHARETVAFREPPQSRNAQIQSIIDDVPSAPPELGADILLKLVERGEITDPTLKRQLIEYAWDLAPKAIYATEFSNSISVMVESETGSLTSSLPGLTTAAVQSRVIALTAATDAKAARELFLKMKAPEPDSPACSASRYASHQSYFKALETVMESFSATETENGEKTQFLKNALRSPANQRDLQLSLELIGSGFPDKDYVQLVDVWSENLSSAHFSDRQFYTVLSLGRSVIETAKQEKAKGGSPENLIGAFRAYFVRHAGAMRCRDGSWRPSRLGPDAPVANNEETMRNEFNSAVSELSLSVSPIGPEEIQPSGIGDSAIVVNYLSLDPTDQMWEVMNAGKHLRFGTPEQQALNEKNRGANNVAPTLTPEQRSTPAWSAEALQHLTQLETWTRGLNEENRGVFVMKAEFYSGLLELTPAGKLHDTVMKSYVNFLVSSPLKRESPPEWAWWGITKLINSSTVSDKHQWLDEIEASGDTTISLYTRLARLALDRTPAAPR